MTDIIRARLKEGRGTDKAAAQVLFSFAEQEDSYADYAAQAENEHEPGNGSRENRSLNTFESLYSPADSGSCLDDAHQNTFESLLTGLGSDEESEDIRNDTVAFDRQCIFYGHFAGQQGSTSYLRKISIIGSRF